MFPTGLLIILCSSQTIVTQIATACAGVANGLFVRNSNSCRAYYYCQDGEAHPNECPDNYLFEPTEQKCHIPSYVQCTGCSLYGIQHIAHPMDCSLYYACVAGVRTLQSCGESLLFDKSIGDCNVASSVQCERDYTQICTEIGEYVKIGDPNDCSKFVFLYSKIQPRVYTFINYNRYYTCLYGVAYHQSCAPGLLFKPATSSCTFPEENDFCQV